MDETAILPELSRILGEVLDDSTIALTMTTERADVPGWDSFAYINFIVGVETASSRSPRWILPPMWAPSCAP